MLKTHAASIIDVPTELLPAFKADINSSPVTWPLCRSFRSTT